MNKSNAIAISLFVLVLYGFVGVLMISYQNLQGNACPHLFFIPVCYVVLGAYSLMLMSLLVPHKGCKYHFFSIGWGVAFIIALLASIAEFFTVGAVCPAAQVGGMRAGTDLNAVVPTCYISLVLLIAILILFMKGPYKQLSAS